MCSITPDADVCVAAVSHGRAEYRVCGGKSITSAQVLLSSWGGAKANHATGLNVVPSATPTGFVKYHELRYRWCTLHPVSTSDHRIHNDQTVPTIVLIDIC